MGKKKNIPEGALFRKLHVFVLDKNKDQLKQLKKTGTMMSNTDLDNSLLVRAFIEYFSDNQDRLQELVPYFKENKGCSILSKLQLMLNENSSNEDISKKIGISLEHLNKILSEKPK